MAAPTAAAAAAHNGAGARQRMRSCVAGCAAPRAASVAAGGGSDLTGASSLVMTWSPWRTGGKATRRDRTDARATRAPIYARTHARTHARAHTRTSTHAHAASLARARAVRAAKREGDVGDRTVPLGSLRSIGYSSVYSSVYCGRAGGRKHRGTILLTGRGSAGGRKPQGY
jgi:hypothetical protein